MKNQLNSSTDKVSQLTKSNTNLEKALAAKSEEAQKASAELSSLKSKPQEAIINNNNINTAAIESELASVKQKLTEKEQETVRLVEENERLSEQVMRDKHFKNGIVMYPRARLPALLRGQRPRDQRW